MKLLDYPPTTSSAFWIKKMAGTAPVRTSDNLTDATETAFDTCLIPAGIVTETSIVRIWSLWNITNNSSTNTTKTLTIRADTNPISSPTTTGVQLVSTNQTTNTAGSLTQQMRFNNSLSSQDMLNGNASIGGGFNTNAILTRTIDFSTDRLITFCGFWAVNQAVTQTITLNGWLVEVFR